MSNSLEDTRLAELDWLTRLDQEPKIEFCPWFPVPGKPGVKRQGEMRDLTHILGELNQRLRQAGIEFDETDFSDVGHYIGIVQWPKDYSRVVVFPVTGGSEGHYIHIAVIAPIDPEAIQKALNAVRLDSSPLAKTVDRHLGEFFLFLRRHQGIQDLALAKTFRGWGHACRIANAAATLLGA